MTVTSTGETGACTLRAAIAAIGANDSGTPCGAVVSGGPTPINLAANTYTPFDGQIVVPSGANVQINGDNINNPLTTVIDGTGGIVSRIFEVKSGGSLTLSGLTVTGGRTTDAPVSSSIYTYVPVDNGGAILNQGSLSIDHSVIHDNRTGNGSQGAPPAPEGDGGAGGPGGGGGAIYNADYASLTITDSEVRDNLTGNGGDGGPGAMGGQGIGHVAQGGDGGKGAYGGSGGGIFNSNFGSVSISNSTISGNDTGRGGNGGQGGQGAGELVGTSGAGNGGWGGDGGNGGRQYRKDQGPGYDWDFDLGGGGIYNLGSLTMTNSTISSNTTGAGGNGGPSGYGGKRDSGTFSSSGAAGTGGGGGRGGGLVVASQQGNATLINVTIFGNRTGDGGLGGDGILGDGGYGGLGGKGGDGGGAFAVKGNGALQLTFVTVVGNGVGAAGAGGGGKDGTAGPGTRGLGAGLSAGGRYSTSGSTIYEKNTLVANNGNPAAGDENCDARYGNDGFYNDFGDLGNNLQFPGGSDCRGVAANPDLALFGDNGGPTETLLPQAGSPAIGGVPLASCTFSTDQRGFPRPGSDGSCDIGAVEAGGAPVLTATTTIVNSSANPSTPGQQVTFTATVSPPPSSGTVDFTDNGSTISGCGATALTPGGQFTCSITYPSAGSHSVVASYSGNTLFQASASSALTQTVGTTTPPPDTTPPDTVIDSGPSGTINVNSATFAFHGTAGDTAKIQCQLDSAAFADCTSPRTFSSLGIGSHTVSFRAQDAAGNMDPSPATRSFTVALPSAKITKVTVSGPSSTRKGGRPTFSVKVTNGGDAIAAGVKVRVTGGGADTSRSIGVIPAGGTRSVSISVKLNKVGLKVLTFKATSTNAGSKSTTRSVNVRKPPKRKRHR